MLKLYFYVLYTQTKESGGFPRLTLVIKIKIKVLVVLFEVLLLEFN